MIFSVIRKSDAKQVYEYQADTPVEWSDFPFAEFDHVELVGDAIATSSTLYGGRRRLTKQEFLDLLGDAAVSFILAAAKQDIEIEKWVKRLDLTTPDPDMTSVDLDDPRTIAGVTAIGAAMVAAGVVSDDWAAEVLRG